MPMSAIRKKTEDDWAARTRSMSGSIASTSSVKLADHMPSPAQGAFSHSNKTSRLRNGSRDRKPDGLSLRMADIVIEDPGLATGTTSSSIQTYGTISAASPSVRSNRSMQSRRTDVLPSPAITEASMKSAKIRSIDEYVNQVDEATHNRSNSKRPESRTRGATETRTISRSRAASTTSEPRGRRYIKPAKRSPSSPISMSPDDPALQMHAFSKESSDDEKFYKIASPTESTMSQRRARSRGHATGTSQGRASSRAGRRAESTDPQGRPRSRSRPPMPQGRPHSPDRDVGRRGRSRAMGDDVARRSPESPVSMMIGGVEETVPGRRPRDQSIGDKVRSRGVSANRASSPDRKGPRERSQSAKAPMGEPRRESPPRRASSRQMSRSRMPRLQTDFTDGPQTKNKALAQRELEARRLSLARRPSAPSIPHPSELGLSRLAIYDEGFNIPSEQMLIRSHTADPEASRRYTQSTLGTSTTSVPIGLPATPRAMRHPKYMTADPSEHDGVPAVPQLPSTYRPLDGSQPPPPPPPPAEGGLLTLPTSVFQPPTRAASAPPEKAWNTATAQRRSSRQDSMNMRPPHQRMGSLNEIVVSPLPAPDSPEGVSAVFESSVVIIEDPDSHRMSGEILPELQHLAMPPPPPPPIGFHSAQNASATSLGVINISIDESGRAVTAPTIDVISPSSPPATTGSPSAIRQGRSSANEVPPASTGMGAKLRGVRDRLRDRSASRHRAKSPPRVREYTRAPYESIPEPPDFERIGSAPPMANRGESLIQTLRLSGEEPRNGGGSDRLQTLPSAAYMPGAASNVMRGPREILAQTTADQLQFGLDHSQLPPRPATTNPGSMGQREQMKTVRANMPPSSLQPGVFEGQPF
jgi:hypothetical protein